MFCVNDPDDVAREERFLWTVNDSIGCGQAGHDLHISAEVAANAYFLRHNFPMYAAEEY